MSRAVSLFFTQTGARLVQPLPSRLRVAVLQKFTPVFVNTELAWLTVHS